MLLGGTPAEPPWDRCDERIDGCWEALACDGVWLTFDCCDARIDGCWEAPACDGGLACGIDGALACCLLGSIRKAFLRVFELSVFRLLADQELSDPKSSLGVSTLLLIRVEPPLFDRELELLLDDREPELLLDDRELELLLDDRDLDELLSEPDARAGAPVLVCGTVGRFILFP